MIVKIPTVTKIYLRYLSFCKCQVVQRALYSLFLPNQWVSGINISILCHLHSFFTITSLLPCYIIKANCSRPITWLATLHAQVNWTFLGVVYIFWNWLNALTAEKFAWFFVFCRFFFKINIFKKFFQEYHHSNKQSGSRWGPIFCRAWSGSKLFCFVWFDSLHPSQQFFS